MIRFAVLASLVLMLLAPARASAAPPVLNSVQVKDRHPSATFAAPRADDATIYFSTKPDRASDGSFLSENVKYLDLLTDSEIQSGQWLGEDQLDPGTYYVLLRASADFTACYSLDLGALDPTCADGYSNMLTLTVPKPATRYVGTVTPSISIGVASLRLTATPLGEKVPYRVCYRLRAGAKRCLSGTLDGYDWDSSCSDTLTVSTRGLPALASFTWYVNGKVVASRRIRVR